VVVAADELAGAALAAAMKPAATLALNNMLRVII
jgi:hypothetical protein